MYNFIILIERIEEIPFYFKQWNLKGEFSTWDDARGKANNCVQIKSYSLDKKKVEQVDDSYLYSAERQIHLTCILLDSDLT